MTFASLLSNKVIFLSRLYLSTSVFKVSIPFIIKRISIFSNLYMPDDWYVSQLFEREYQFNTFKLETVFEYPFTIVFRFEVLVQNPSFGLVTVPYECPSFELPDQNVVYFCKHYFRHYMSEIVTPSANYRIKFFD